MENLRIALLQTSLHWENPAANRATMLEKLSELNSHELDVIILPEMFNTGFTMNPEPFAEETLGETYQMLHEQSLRLDALIMGSMNVVEGGRFYNRLVAVGPNGLMAKYDKRHLFRMGGEDKVYTMGEERVLINWRGWNIRPLICYDLRFPVWSRCGAEDDLLVYVANWPNRRAYVWNQLLIARAIENQVFLAGVNRVGVDGHNVEHDGNSVILSPKGESIVSAEVGKEEWLFASLSKAELKEFKEQFPAYKDADQFQIL